MIVKIIITTIIFMAIFSGGKIAIAVDLPINIDVITQDVGIGEAHTANRNIEVFTPNARQLSRAINEHATQRRETKLSDLFAEYGSRVTSKSEQITSAAHNLALFAEPLNFSGMRMVMDDDSIPVWLIVLIFTISTVGGFVLAALLIQRKRGTNVH